MSAPGFPIPLLRAAAWSQEPLPGPPAPGFLHLATGTPEIAFIEPLLRRRLSALGRGMLHCAGRVAGDLPSVRAVFASQHGEPARTMPMLEDLARSLDISPTQFSMNVHNAVAGIWSIARRDRSACTALGAGAESFGWGLLEAFSLHLARPDEPVLFVYGDDRLPEGLAEAGSPDLPLHAVALLLGSPAVRRLHLGRDPFADGDLSPAPQSLQGLRALGGEAQVPRWLGPSGAWTWRLE